MAGPKNITIDLSCNTDFLEYIKGLEKRIAELEKKVRPEIKDDVERMTFSQAEALTESKTKSNELYEGFLIFLKDRGIRA